MDRSCQIENFQGVITGMIFEFIYKLDRPLLFFIPPTRRVHVMLVWRSDYSTCMTDHGAFRWKIKLVTTHSCVVKRAR